MAFCLSVIRVEVQRLIYFRTVEGFTFLCFGLVFNHSKLSKNMKKSLFTMGAKYNTEEEKGSINMNVKQNN